MTYVVMDIKRNDLLSDDAKKTLQERYMLPHEESPQEAFARAALAFSHTEEMAQRIYEYASKQWFMFATPVLANAPVRTKWIERSGELYWQGNLTKQCYETARGMPISCFLNYVPDSLDGIGKHWVENMYLASQGGGIGGHWSDIRSDGAATSKGSSSNGVIPFIKVVDSEMGAVSQGKTRRGSYAAYLDVSHPEIEEFLGIRKPSGGDINRKALNLHHGVNLPDSFMRIIEACEKDPEADPSWELVDPNSKEVVAVVDARDLWQKILENRIQTGEPYMAFIDTINDALPEPMREAGLKVRGSNLCSEITLPTDEHRTAVCCLSSVNLAKWDEWQNDPLFIDDLVTFLDNVLEYFIQNAPKTMSKAIESARDERSIGLGAMGFHTLLQSKYIPFESALAVSINNTVFDHIKEKANATTRRLAESRGPAPAVGSLGVRNAHLMAIAPNASSSLICGGVSPSIEPLRANAFVQKTLSGSLIQKNPQLASVIDEYAAEHGKDLKWVDAQWKSIATHKGSVQHLEWMGQYTKDIFKTAMELDQRWIVSHTGDRQKYLCQSQSVNLFLPPDVPIPVLHDLHLQAWKRGLKTLYYVRSEALRRAEVVSAKVERKNLYRFNEETCLACEG